MKVKAIGITWSAILVVVFFCVAFSIDQPRMNEEPIIKKSAGQQSLRFSENSELMLNETPDVGVVNQKIQSAVSVLNQFWANEFARKGYRHYQPRVYTFYGTANSRCGQIGDAAYCALDHTIYLNLNFLDYVMTSVGSRLRSDGDMAVVTVVAHEAGHAIQGQTGGMNYLGIIREQNADCLAGAFTLYSYQQGYLDSDDLAEAAQGLADGGDNYPWFDPRAHGSSQQRIAAFNRGLQGGTGACGF